MELKFETIAGDHVVYQLPSEGCDEAAGLIDAAASSIASEYKQRRLAKAELFRWLRPAAYQLISTCLDYNLQHLLYRRSLAAGRYQRGHDQSPNPFQLGLMAIFAEDEYSTKGDRNELGKLLWYAYRHYVPLCFINGFASQVGAISKDNSENYLEPEFSDWIVERRLLDLWSGRGRANYPTHIEERVRKLRTESAGTLGPIFETLAGLQDPQDEVGEL
jgi:hypothetical protein